MALAAAPAPADAATTGVTTSLTETERLEQQKRYETALQHYANGDYRPAIEEWTEILKKDPSQKSAEKMLRTARDKIDARDKKDQEKLFEYSRRGRYQKALVVLQVLLQADPTHPLYATLQARLERLSEIVPSVPEKSRAWNKAVAGLGGYIARQDDLQLAYNGLRYAQELDPAEKRFERLIALILAADPSLAKDKLPPGMSLLKYKLSLGLSEIQNGRYLQAVSQLEEVLALEPNDVTALKRIGSSYFMLKRYPQAEAAWQRAAGLAPQDPQLQKFLARVRQRAGRR